LEIVLKVEPFLKAPEQNPVLKFLGVRIDQQNAEHLVIDDPV